MKFCYLCRVYKNKVEFHKDSSRLDKLNSCCKLCKKNKDALKYKINKIEMNKNRVKNNYKKRKSDLLYNFKESIRCLLKNTFRRKKYKKNSKTYNILGCSIEELKVHLESKFQPGMTWENHGIHGWHIDHIMPISMAKTEEDIIKLNHYTNLQPLWAIDNLKKSNKINV